MLVALSVFSRCLVASCCVNRTLSFKQMCKQWRVHSDSLLSVSDVSVTERVWFQLLVRSDCRDSAGWRSRDATLLGGLRDAGRCVHTCLYTLLSAASSARAHHFVMPWQWPQPASLSYWLLPQHRTHNPALTACVAGVLQFSCDGLLLRVIARDLHNPSVCKT